MAISEVGYCPSPLVTDITAALDVVSKSNPQHHAEILSLDTSGYKNERPRVVWTAPDVLQVTVPNKSDPSVARRSYQGIWIDLRFDPDDRTARANWLRENHLEPDPLER